MLSERAVTSEAVTIEQGRIQDSRREWHMKGEKGKCKKLMIFITNLNSVHSNL